MITNFDDYINENIRDLLKPKSPDEIKKHIQNLKDSVDDFNLNQLGSIISIVVQIMSGGDLFKILIDEHGVDVVELLYLCLGDPEYNHPHMKYFIKMRPEIIHKILELIEDNIDKIENVEF